jgi:hypothetical protein
VLKFFLHSMQLHQHQFVFFASSPQLLDVLVNGRMGDSKLAGFLLLGNGLRIGVRAEAHQFFASLNQGLFCEMQIPQALCCGASIYMQAPDSLKGRGPVGIKQCATCLQFSVQRLHPAVGKYQRLPQRDTEWVGCWKV